MNFIKHENNIVELAEKDFIINSAQDALDLIGEAGVLAGRGSRGSTGTGPAVIVRQANLHPGFFDLSNGIAGDVLQKFVNYSVRLAVVGDFSNIEKKSLRDFIYESNKHGPIYFVASLEAALAVL